MQLLYTMSRDKKLSLDKGNKEYVASIQKSFELLLYALSFFLEVCKYAEKDASIRAGKHLPTQEDFDFTPRLFRNNLIKSLTTNHGLAQKLNRYKIHPKMNLDVIRLTYQDFAKGDKYIQYSTAKDPIPESENSAILVELLKYLSKSDIFLEEIEDKYATWEDDKSLIIGTLKRIVKSLPVESEQFILNYYPSPETVQEFGQSLFEEVINKDKELLGMIQPVLKNWDVDRVAVIDMIILKMAICELVSFPTIPTKVTLNEFVEMAKVYSTDKSKDFINGILDRLLKKLNKDGRIKKEGRGLIE